MATRRGKFFWNWSPARFRRSNVVLVSNTDPKETTMSKTDTAEIIAILDELEAPVTITVSRRDLHNAMIALARVGNVPDCDPDSGIFTQTLLAFIKAERY